MLQKLCFRRRKVALQRGLLRKMNLGAITQVITSSLGKSFIRGHQLRILATNAHKPPTCNDNSLTLWPSQAVLIWERRGAGVVRTWAGVQSEGWTATVATLNTSSLRWAASSYLSHLVTLVLSTLLLLLLLLLRVFTSVAASRLSRSLGFSSMVTTRPPSPALRLLSSGQSPQGMGSAQETKPTWSKTLKPVKWLAPLRDPSAPRFPASTMVTLQQRQGRRWHQRRQGKSLWWRSRRRRPRASQVSALLMGAGAGGWSSPPSWSTSSVSENIHTIYHPTRLSNPILLADGITYSFGIFLVALIDKFNADRGYASLIPSILVGITLGAGMWSHLKRI